MTDSENKDNGLVSLISLLPLEAFRPEDLRLTIAIIPLWKMIGV